jgi:hypothetical protein
VYSTHSSRSKHAYDAETDLLRRFVARRAVLATTGGGLDGELAAVERGAQWTLANTDAPTRIAQLQALLEALVADPTNDWVRKLAGLYLARLDGVGSVRDCDG